MKKIALHWKIIIGLVLGVIWALISSTSGLTQFTLNWIDPFGKIFVNLLKMIAVPLVLFSIIKGVSDLKDVTKLGKVGIKTLGLYLITTVIAVSVGLVIVNVFKPGSYLSENQAVKNRISYELWCQETGNTIKDGKSYLTDPAYEQYLEVAKADYEKNKEELNANTSIKAKQEEAFNQSNARPLDFIVDFVPKNIFVSFSSDKLMLQIIFFAIFFGITLLMIDPGRAAPVVAFVDGTTEVFLKMVDLIMKGAPFFVFALLAGTFSEMAGDDPQSLIDMLASLMIYALVVLVGLLFMIFVFYPLVMLVVAGKKISYGGFFKRISPAQFLAFSTSSSAATLPVTIECVRDRLGVSKEVTSFVLPIGATVNMDGTSLYQAVAAIFLAQYHLIELDLTQQLTIIITATMASIGSAAVPSAGLVMLMIVLSSVGLNPAWIAIIMPIDRILDMCRTVVNVTGDATVATVVASTEGELNVTSDADLELLEK